MCSPFRRGRDKPGSSITRMVGVKGIEPSRDFSTAFQKQTAARLRTYTPIKLSKHSCPECSGYLTTKINTCFSKGISTLVIIKIFFISTPGYQDKKTTPAKKIYSQADRNSKTEKVKRNLFQCIYNSVHDSSLIWLTENDSNVHLTDSESEMLPLHHLSINWLIENDSNVHLTGSKPEMLPLHHRSIKLDYRVELESTKSSFADCRLDHFDIR